MNKYKKGDRVKVKKCGIDFIREFAGMTGTIVCIYSEVFPDEENEDIDDEYDYGIKFDKPNQNFHNLRGHCDQRFGYWAKHKEVSLCEVPNWDE